MLRRTALLALVGACFVATPALAAGDDDKGDKADKSDADGKKDDTSGAASKSSSSDADDGIERVDGVNDCKLFRDANARERKMWEAAQPPTPYVYPQRDTVLDAGWGEYLSATGHTAGLIAATLIPHVNAVLRSLSPEPGLSWPWSVQLGPVMTCSRRQGSFDVDVYRPLRLLLEPGFLAGSDRTIAVFVRPGMRFMYHPSAWVVGVGGGVGSMIELSGKEPVRASLSPEGVLQLGHCCNPGYFTLAVRRDFFFAGRTQIWAATVGFTYF